MSDWAVHESGMISQSLTDMMDSSVRLFTETAAEHNQAIHDAKSCDGSTRCKASTHTHGCFADNPCTHKEGK